MTAANKHHHGCKKDWPKQMPRQPLSGLGSDYHPLVTPTPARAGAVRWPTDQIRPGHTAQNAPNHL